VVKEHNTAITGVLPVGNPGRRLAGAIRAGALALFLALAGPGHALGDLPLVHTETVDLGALENLSISYGHDEVILRESENGELVIKEYMNRDNPRYYARISRSAGTLQVKQGRRPWFPWNWRARVEIYLPRSFRGNLRLSNSSGTFSADGDLLGYKSVDISVGSGTVLLNDISGDSVSFRISSGELEAGAVRGKALIGVSSGRLWIGSLKGEENRVKVSSGGLRIGALEGYGVIEISSGNIVVEQTRGRVEADVSSGRLELEKFSGQGAFEVSSGNLRLDLAELEGDLHFKLSSGTVELGIPRALSFNLDAVTRSGTVQVSENGAETLKVSGTSTVLRPLGPSPERTIFARTSSGNLFIKRH
jgi:hypothetical protein